MARTIHVGDTAFVFFDVRVENTDQPALNEAGGQPQTLLNNGSWTNSGISVLTSVGFGRYTAIFDTTQLSITIGDVILTRYAGITTSETAGDTFVVISDSDTLPNDIPSVAYYGSIAEADLFFNNRLRAQKWSNASPDDKRRALIQSTQIIDRLNFAGNKLEQNQVLQFPRMNSEIIQGVIITSSDINIPQDIKFATFLIAIKLLEGYDPEREARALAMNMQKYQTVQAIYERKFIPEYQVAGIPSAEAWGFIRPYLRDSNELELVRV